MKSNDRKELEEMMAAMAKPGYVENIGRLESEKTAVEPTLPDGWSWVEQCIGEDGVPVLAGLPDSLADIDPEWALNMIHSQLVNHGVYGKARGIMAARKIALLEPKFEKELIKQYFKNSQKAGGKYLMTKPAPKAENKAAALLAEQIEKCAAGLLAKGKVKTLEAGRELAKEILA